MEKSNIALAKAIAAVKARFGESVIRTIHEHEDAQIVQTDLPEFNAASNLNGCPLGRVIEIYGPESSGKTSLSWQVAASLQKRTKKKILFMDYERSTSESYLKKLGVNTEEIYFGLPKKSSLETGFEVARMLLPTNEFCIIIWDSLAAMVPDAEMAKVEEEGLGSQTPMVKAKSMAQALRVTLDMYRDTNTTSIFINHLIAKPAMNGMPQYGDPEETPGGKALKYYSDLRISLKPRGFIVREVPSEDGKKKLKVKVGREVGINFVKNKLADPFGSDTLTLRNGKGFDVITSTIKKAIKMGVVVAQSTGKHYLKSDEAVNARSYHGFYDLVSANPTLLKALTDAVNGGATTVKFDSKKLDTSILDKELTAKDVLETDETEEELVTSGKIVL